MRTYTFHHFGRSATASSLTFGFFDTDEAALEHARHLLRRDALRCVEVCDGPRLAGAVGPDHIPAPARAATGGSARP